MANSSFFYLLQILKINSKNPKMKKNKFGRIDSWSVTSATLPHVLTKWFLTGVSRNPVKRCEKQ